METLVSSTGLSATAGKGRRRKVRKLAGGRGVASHGNSRPLVSDPQPEDPNLMGIGGNEGRGIGGSDSRAIGTREAQDPPVYLVVCRGHWFSSRGCYYPLHKVEVGSPDASSSREAPEASHVTNMRTDIGFKTFVSVQSRWIIGVGGDPGRTLIFDTKTAKAISGPKLVATKLCPVVVAVGYRIYALSAGANFTEGPGSTPFEVLDLSEAMDSEGNLSLLAQCSWEALPPPLFFCKLPKSGYLTPHVITIMSYVVVEHYILLSVYEPRTSNYKFSFTSDEYNKVTYAFDTKSEQWHKLDDTCLPFFGSATPLGCSGCIFIGSSGRNGPLSAYRICVSTSSDSSTMAGVSDKDGRLKLSITVFSIKTKAHESVGAGHYFTSLDGTCFSTLFHSLDNRQRHEKYSQETGEFYSMMLDAKLRTYQIERESLALMETPDEEKLRAVKPEIAVSSQREQAFRIFSAQGEMNWTWGKTRPGHGIAATGMTLQARILSSSVTEA